MTAVNLLEDGGIEKSTDRWTSASTANCSAAARTEAGDANRRHGTGGLNLYLSSSATSSNYAGIYRSESLKAGKAYTLSAYFSVSSYLNWKDGAKLELLVQNGSSTLQTFLLTDTKPSADIESGWQRVSATYTPASDGTYRFLFRLSGCTGTAYLDDVQLEQADAASTYNLIQNGSFEFGTAAWDTSNWQTNNAACAQPAEQRFGTHAARITGKQDGRARVSQRVMLNCSSDTTFLLSGWALAQYAAPNPARECGECGEEDEENNKEVRYFGLIAEITYSDNTSEWQSVPFEWSTTDWQCAVGTIVPKQSGKTVSHINIYCAYDFNSGTVWFDNIALRQEPVQTYRYDEKGNVTAATQTGTGTENAQYDSNGVDLLQYTAANGTKYSYEYNNAHDVTKTTVGSLTATTSYNKSGNTTGARLVGKDSNENASLALQSSATPTADRNHTASVTDANGSTTSYTYNGQTELLATSTNAAGRQTTYEYYLSSGRAKSTYQSGVAAIGYTYSGGRLSQLDRKTYRSGAAQHQYYNFAYNVWGQTTTTKVGSRTLSTNTYYNYVNDDTARGGNLKSTTYANGDSVSYTYDRFDRLVRKSYNSGSYVAYTYNAEGSLARLSYGDSTGELASYRFEYDSLGRLIRSAELDADGGTVQRTEHIYDGYNRLSRQSWTLGGKTYSESYVYDDPSDTNKNGDGALTQMTTATGAVIDYQYDTLRRLTRSKVALNGSTVYTTAYAFRDLDASRTTTQVQYRNVRNANGEVLEGKKYTYDAIGNITRISQSIKPFYTLVAYEYDAQNQLTKETYYNGEGTAAGNITRTISYTYDTAGNILSETKTVGSKTTTKTFSYTDSNWKDLLTAVNGLSITYDASGNPETYYTGSVDRRGNAEVYDMYWGNGRQLTDVETDDGQTRSQISYGYDADGIRSWKAVDGEIHTYLTQGGKVMRETVGSTVMDFAYDESGRPFAMTYQSANEDPQTYYYVLNLQGDVVKLVTASGTEAASYAYDAWGNLLSATGSMAYTNPLRYCGYYYDAETRFYYLQSRYYDPVYHRFINADVYASTGQGFVGTNMFAYCKNDPVTGTDPSGYRPSWERRYENGLVEYTDTGTGRVYYQSMDEAAHVGGVIAAQNTQKTNFEYAFEIYQDKDKYYLSPIIKGEHSSVGIGRSPKGTLVGAVHSHPYCTGHDGNHFSTEQYGALYGDAKAAYYFNIVVYLAAPNGTLQKMTVTEASAAGMVEVKISTIANDLPIDQTLYDCLN